MEPGSPQQFLGLFILLILSAFFSMTETALTALSKIRIRNMEDEGIVGASHIKKLTDNPKNLLTAILIGKNLVNIGASSIATAIVISSFGNNSSSVGIVIGIITLIIVVFCEITPKVIATQKSEEISLLVCKPIGLFIALFSPLIGMLNFGTDFFIRIFGGNINKTMPLITEAELKTLLNVSHEEGLLEGDEKTMIHNVFEFGESRAKDVMIPRIDIIAINYNSTYEEIEAVFLEEGFSRLPVYKENTDDIVGILYFKDFVFSKRKNKDFSIDECMREPYFTYESKPTIELFSIMRVDRIQMSIVLDEYGGTSGIVTLEDLIEEIVGDISDELDEDVEVIEVIKEDEYVVEGSTKITEFNDMAGTNLESEDFDSIGGYVIGVLGKIPEEGEIIQSDGIKFVIEEIDKNRIEKLHIYT